MKTVMQKLVEKIIEEQSKLTSGNVTEFAEFKAYKKVLVHILNLEQKK